MRGLFIVWIVTIGLAFGCDAPPTMVVFPRGDADSEQERESAEHEADEESAEPETLLCTPGERYCASLREHALCMADGTWRIQACPGGERCYSRACLPPDGDAESEEAPEASEDGDRREDPDDAPPPNCPPGESFCASQDLHALCGGDGIQRFEPCLDGQLCYDSYCGPREGLSSTEGRACQGNIDCQEGYSCFVGECRRPCTITPSCTEGYGCQSGFCLPTETPIRQPEDRPCQSDRGCQPGLSCFHGQCTRICVDSSSCPTGKRCLSRLCLPGTPQAEGGACWDDAGCKDGRICFSGACRRRCAATPDCPENRYCQSNFCLPTSESVCRQDSDCHAPFFCRKGWDSSGQCLPECGSDWHICQRGYSCQITSATVDQHAHCERDSGPSRVCASDTECPEGHFCRRSPGHSVGHCWRACSPLVTCPKDFVCSAEGRCLSANSLDCAGTACRPDEHCVATPVPHCERQSVCGDPAQWMFSCGPVGCCANCQEVDWGLYQCYEAAACPASCPQGTFCDALSQPTCIPLRCESPASCQADSDCCEGEWCMLRSDRAGKRCERPSPCPSCRDGECCLLDERGQGFCATCPDSSVYVENCGLNTPCDIGQVCSAPERGTCLQDCYRCDNGKR